MSRFLLSAFVFALPLLEIAGFVVVGRQIGALATIGLVLLSGIIGMALLRQQGFGVMSRARAEMAAGRDPSGQLAHGVMILVAAFLLVVPGFLTDIAGLLLFLPPVRDLVWRRLKGRIVTVGGFRRGFGTHERTIDLDMQDFSRDEPNPDSPWRRLKDE